jgi:hypothetical protein
MDNKDYFSEIIDICLERYNWIDNKLWSLLNSQETNDKLSHNVSIIHTKDILNVLYGYFPQEVNKFSSINQKALSDDVNSIYFLWKILDNKPNTKWVRYTQSANKRFNRLVTVDGMKTVNFSIKTIRGTFRTWEHFDQSVMPKVNELLTELGIIDADNHYSAITVTSLVEALSGYREKMAMEEEQGIADPTKIEIIENLLQYFEVFYEENTEALIITDYSTNI